MTYMKIGLALGGGAARGLTHIGVLEVLEEAKVPIHCIAGTSIGAVIGGYYALHKDVAKLKEVAKDILGSNEFKRVGFDLFGGSELPKPFRNIIDFVKEKYIYTKGILTPYILKEDDLNRVLKKLFGDVLISATKIPFVAVAIDLVRGENIVIKKGQLRDAVRASISIPGVFPPVELSSGILVDGGSTSSVPTYAVKELGADFIIAVSLLKELMEPESLSTAFKINLRIDEIVKHRLNLLNLASADIIIAPEVDDVHWADFSQLDLCVEKGREATLKALPQIKSEISLFGRLRRWAKAK